MRAKIGDTMECRINDEPRRLTWRDAETLVIEPGDPRTIIQRTTNGELIHFACTDPGGDPRDYTVIR
jgi:hypothetical protein